MIKKDRVRKMKKFSTYAFWVGLSSAIVIFLEDIETLLGVNINTQLIENLILSFCGILVVLGIVVKDKKKEEDLTTNNNDTDDEDIVER